MAMTYELLRKRHLLERHAVHTCGGTANRGRKDHRRLHDGERSKRVDEWKGDVDGGKRVAGWGMRGCVWGVRWSSEAAARGAWRRWLGDSCCDTR